MVGKFRLFAVIVSIVAFPIYAALASASDLCPPLSKAQWIITRISKGTFTVKSLKPLKSFNACQINTNEGETFFLSASGREVIEGILLQVPVPKVSKRDYEILKSNVLFYVGKGKKLLLIATNPLCQACRTHRGDIKKLIEKYRVGFIPVGFDRKEELAAVDAFCRGKRGGDFFNIPENWNLCDKGKLRVWTVQDILKKYGISGTPVFILPDGSIEFNFEKFLQ